MKTLLTILLVWMICINMKGQEVVVYKTYQDFQNNTGEKYDKFLNYLGKFKFEKGGEKIKISYEDLWGFKVAGELFMMYGEGKHAYPYKVFIIGSKLCYYEDGFKFLGNILKESTFKTDKGATISYVSKDLQSKVMPIRYTGFDGSENKKGMADLKKALPGPDYQSFFECLNGSVYYFILRDCTRKFVQ